MAIDACYRSSPLESTGMNKKYPLATPRHPNWPIRQLVIELFLYLYVDGYLCSPLDTLQEIHYHIDIFLSRSVATEQ